MQLPGQHRNVTGPPGLDQHALAAAQPDPAAGLQHMVAAAAVAGQPDPALLHGQPARARRLEPAGTLKAKLARHRVEPLVVR